MKGTKRNRRYIAATIAALGATAAFAASANAVPTATTIPLPGPDSRPEGITLGPDGAVYYADFGGHSIVRTTSGPGQPFSVPNDGALGPLVDVSGPAFITTGPDNALWFTAFNGTVGRMAAGGGLPVGFTAVASPTANLRGIAAGAANTLWFAEAEGDMLRSVTTSGAAGPQPAVNLGATGLNLGTPEALVAGPGDGNIYFTTSLGTVGKKDTSNASAAHHDLSRRCGQRHHVRSRREPLGHERRWRGPGPGHQAVTRRPPPRGASGSRSARRHWASPPEPTAPSGWPSRASTRSPA